MIFHLNDDINEKSVQKLTNAYNSFIYDYQKDMPTEKMEIIFASNGGENSSAMALVYLINSHKAITNLTAYSHIFSNGFRIFFEAECTKQILPETIGMYHLVRSNAIIFEGGVTHNADFDEFLKRDLNSFNYFEKTNELVNFSKSEISHIKSNRDLWLTNERLQKMLSYNKKLLKIK